MIDISIFFFASVFIAGMLSFFAPCIIPLLPVYVSTLSSSAEKVEKSSEKSISRGITINWRLVVQTLVFVGGLGTTFVMLGFGAGALGGLLGSKTFLRICGAFVILLGLHQTGLLHMFFLDREKRLDMSKSNKTGLLGSYLLGLTFSFGWTPCIGPILATVLLLASNSSQILYGVVLMLVYTLGLAVPFLIISIFTNYMLKAFKKVNKYLPVIRVIGGILIIAMGIILMTDNLNFISSIF